MLRVQPNEKKTTIMFANQFYCFLALLLLSLLYLSSLEELDISTHYCYCQHYVFLKSSHVLSFIRRFSEFSFIPLPSPFVFPW